MNLNELRDKAYNMACRHRWHENELSDEHFLMLIITELSEAVKADREGKYARINDYEFDKTFAIKEAHLYGRDLDDFLEHKFEVYIKDTVEDELADVVIRCLDLAGARKIDLKVKEGDHEAFSEDTFTEAIFRITRVAAYGCSDGLWLGLPEIIGDVLAFCRLKGVDIEWHVKQKMRYNESRPMKHGKKY